MVVTAKTHDGESQLLVQVQDLTKRFPTSENMFRRARSFVHAVDGISFDIRPGESLGLVGESGCGKTTTGRLLVRLIEPSAGRVSFRGEDGDLADIADKKGRDLKLFRRRVQMIFQDPYESMNPRRVVLDTIAEPLVVQRIGGPAERRDRVIELMELVGLTPPSMLLYRYPHELSGGQRQRVSIARALIVEPSFVVADEPTSMLDVSIRTGIMKLMMDLAQQLELSYLYITHDLAVARYMCDRLAVMYAGKIVEIGETEEVLRDPQHPYTKALLSAVPVLQAGTKRGPIHLKSSFRPAVDPLPRCRFYERCPIAVETCKTSPHPPLEDKGAGHLAACYRAQDVAAMTTKQ